MTFFPGLVDPEDKTAQVWLISLRRDKALSWFISKTVILFVR